MEVKEYFSTGEVSEILDISRATVSRKFDTGIIYGKRNPITGERHISRDSLIDFMRQYDIPFDSLCKTARKKLLVRSDDAQFKNLVTQTFSNDKKIEVITVTSGYDAIIMCSKAPPDIFIIDNEHSDISYVEAIKSLRHQDENVDMKILYCLKTYDSEKFMKIPADDYLAKDTMKESTLIDKVNKLLYIASVTQRPDDKYTHMRKWPRIHVNIPGNLGLYHLDNPHIIEKGEAIVENISLGGASLSKIHIEKGNIPTDTIKFKLEINKPPLNDFQSECNIVRLNANNALTAGIQFVNISQQNKEKISSLSV